MSSIYLRKDETRKDDREWGVCGGGGSFLKNDPGRYTWGIQQPSEEGVTIPR